jgi:hypothetical protein
METIYFSIGVLTMVLVALAALATYSTVMVTKLKKETREDRTEIWRHMHENHQIVHRKFEDVERQLRGEMRCGEQELSNQMDQLNEHISQLTSSTDRRFDKLIDTYLLVKDAEETNKKLIKG